MKISTKNLSASALICAFSYILMIISKTIPAVSGFLQFDLKDIAVTIGGFVLGPLYAILIAFVVALLEFITVSDTGLIGLIMNFISTAAFCGVASVIYSKKKTLKSAVLSLFLATISLTVIMLLWNYYITPLYMKIPRSTVASMLIPVFLPFNLIKGLINSGLILILYKPVVSGLRRAGLLRANSKVAPKNFPITVIIGIVILVISVPFLLSMIGLI